MSKSDQATSIEKTKENKTPEIDSLFDQIQRLGELREKGILTEQEFLAQKQKLFE